MNQQDLSNSFWSFGQLEIQDVALICAAAGRVLPMLSSARPSSDVAKDLALLAWSLAKLELATRRLMSAAADQSLKQIEARTCGPQAPANTAWAFATYAQRHEPPFEAVARLSLETISESDQQEFGNLTNAAWAFAEVRFRSAPFTEASFILLSAADMQMSQEEAARGGYAMAWAQDRHGRPDLTRSLVLRFVAGERCHSLAWGLVIQDEEWRHHAPRNGAAATLQGPRAVFNVAMLGEAMARNEFGGQ
eukprot:s3300_g18.t2